MMIEFRKIYNIPCQEIRPDSCRKTPENIRKMEAVFRPEVSAFFLTNGNHFLMAYDHYLARCPRKTGRKSPKEIRE